MRKICDSRKVSCTKSLSSIALARSVPNGFSITTRDRSTRSASLSIVMTASAALGGTDR